MWKGLGEKGFAAAFGVAAARRYEPAARTKTWVGQKTNVVDIDNERVEDGWRWLWPCEFVDDYMANEFAQRGDPSVMPVRSEETRASQTWRPERIEHAIVGLGIEQHACGIEIAVPR